MQCGKCKFVVPANMRFCLMKNMCPSCGSPLFSDSDMNHLSMLQNRVNGKNFANDMDQVQIYDLALFIFNEIKSGYGRTILDAEVKKLTTNSSPASEADVQYKQEDEAPEVEPEESSDIDAIKLEVEAELREQIKANLELDSAVEMGSLHEDDDDKIERLKAQAKKHNKRITGPSVRRLS